MSLTHAFDTLLDAPAWIEPEPAALLACATREWLAHFDAQRQRTRWTMRVRGLAAPQDRRHETRASIYAAAALRLLEGTRRHARLVDACDTLWRLSSDTSTCPSEWPIGLWQGRLDEMTGASA